MKEYDVLIIGSGPGGEKAAVQASKLGKKVGVIENRPVIGGAGLHLGTLPSKTLRETAVFLAGLKQRGGMGFQCSIGKDVTLGELMHKKTEVIKGQMDVVNDHFARNNIEIIFGEASFVDEYVLAVKGLDGNVNELRAGVIVIATGSGPARPEGVPFDADHVYDSDTILNLDSIPRRLTVIGGGVIGCEYACIFACLGVKVTIVEKRNKLLGFADREIVESLQYWMRHTATTLRLGEEVVNIEVQGADKVVTGLKSGKVVNSDKLLYTMGRVGNTDVLNLSAVGLKADEKRKLLTVNKNFQTEVDHVYAVGDVIGYPSLASTSREQGRLAMCHAFGEEGSSCTLPGQMPFGIYTIPEISMVGKNEEELTEAGVAYESGTALFAEVARGQISGDIFGMLKLLFHRETKLLLGVHIIGEKAAELIHIGQAVMDHGGSVEYFKNAVFNYPTLTDAYKQAALNGLNKL